MSEAGLQRVKSMQQLARLARREQEKVVEVQVVQERDQVNQAVSRKGLEEKENKEALKEKANSYTNYSDGGYRSYLTLAPDHLVT